MTDQISSTNITDEHEYVNLSGEVLSQLRDLISAADPDVTSSQLEEFNRQFQTIVQSVEKKALKAEGGHLDILATKLAVHQVQRDCLSVITKHYTEENRKPNVIKVFSSLVNLDNINNDEIFKSTPDTRSEVDSDEDEAAPAPPSRQDQIKNAVRSVKSFVFSSLPVLEWVPKYRFPQFRGDITAALAVGFMIIPQGLAYAILAGMPPIYGLYTAWSPLFIYFLFGSSRELAVGPTAMVSLVIPTVVGDTQVSGTEEYAQQVIFYSFIYGFVLTVLGVLRIGFLLENILSRPALNGFTQGAAVLIACSQLKNLLGLPAIHVNYTVPELLSAVFHHIEAANLWSCLMGFISIAIIMFFKKVKKSFPSIIFILAIAILITYLTKLDEKGLKIVGTVPPGVPKPKTTDISGRDISETFGAVLVLVFMGFVESVSVAKKFAAENQYHLHVSQELLALGMASMIGSAFQAYPVSGSLPRTVVNAHTGAKTPMASLFAGLIVTLMLSFATPLIYYTPLSVLGAIVASAALAIIDFNDIKFLWRINEKVDLIKYLLTYFATMLFGPIMGVVFAGLLSLLQVIYWSSRPKFILLGKVGVAWRDVDSYANTVQVPGVLIVRMDAPRMSFYNISWFREGLENMELRVREEGSQTPLQAIIIDLSPTNGVDATAIQYLQEIVGSYQKRGIKLYWVAMKSNIKSVFEQTGVTQNKTHRNIYSKIEDALQETKADIRASSENTGGMVQLEVQDDSTQIQASTSNPLASSGRLENDIMDLGERKDATFKRAPLVPLNVDQYAKWDV